MRSGCCICSYDSTSALVKLPNDPFSHHFSLPSNLDGEADGRCFYRLLMQEAISWLVNWLLVDYCWLLSLSTT